MTVQNSEKEYLVMYEYIVYTYNMYIYLYHSGFKFKYNLCCEKYMKYFFN